MKRYNFIVNAGETKTERGKISYPESIEIKMDKKMAWKTATSLLTQLKEAEDSSSEFEIFFHGVLG